MKYLKVDFNIQPTGMADFNRQDSRDLIAALTGGIGFESFEDTDNGIIGYVQEQLFNLSDLETLIDNFPIESVDITFHTNEAEYKDWNKEWEDEGYEPITIADRCIVHDTRHTPDKSYPIDIIIDARLAFGTGTHQTTQMIISHLLNMELRGKEVLDCGCGTGILSIAALKNGARSATGYDIDEWSTENARHNAQLNQVEHLNVHLGDASLLNREIIGPFDIVIANINRNILQTDMPFFVSVMKDEATLILSGFYVEDVDTLVSQAAGYGLKLNKKSSEDNWCSLLFVRKKCE